MLCEFLIFLRFETRELIESIVETEKESFCRKHLYV